MQVLTFSDSDRVGTFAPLKKINRPKYALLESDENDAIDDLLTNETKEEECDPNWYLACVFTSCSARNIVASGYIAQGTGFIEEERLDLSTMLKVEPEIRV